MGLRIKRPHGNDSLGDFGRPIEPAELMIFRRQKIEPRGILRIRRDLFVQNPDVPEVSAPPRFGIGGEIVVDRNRGAHQAPASREYRRIDGLMHASAIAVGRPVREETHDVIRSGGLRTRFAIAAPKIISGVFVPRGELLNQRNTGSLEGLVGIQHHDPPAARARQRVVAGGGKIDGREIEGSHIRAVTRRDSGRGVGRSGIHYDQFGAEPSHRIEAPPETALLVLYDHAEA